MELHKSNPESQGSPDWWNHFFGWWNRFLAELPEFPKAQRAIECLERDERPLPVVLFLAWAYTYKWEVRKQFADATAPPGGVRDFVRDVQNCALRIQSFNMGAGKHLLAMLDAMSIMYLQFPAEPNWKAFKRAMVGGPRTFRILPPVLKAYASWVEAGTQHLRETVLDKRRACSRILAMLAYNFTTQTRIDFRAVAAVLQVGYSANSIVKDDLSDIALAVRNRLDRLRESHPDDYAKFCADATQIDPSLKLPLFLLPWFQLVSIG